MAELVPEEDLAVLGSYLPRAFAITMLHPAIAGMTAPGPGPLMIPAAAFPTLMHEFAHLVQDWSSFRGIIDFSNLWDQVRAISHHVGRSGNDVPFPIVQPKGKNHRLVPETEYAVELEMLRAMTEPRIEWGKGKTWKFERYEVGAFAFPLAGRRVGGRAVIVHLIEETSGEKITHRLGAWEIKEAHSVAVGILHGGKPKNPQGSGFEYMIVGKILAHYFDAVTPLEVIALCQWALQDLAPANTLFSLIEIFEPNGRKLPSADIIYDECRKEALGRDFSRNSKDIVKQLQDTANAYHASGNDMMAVLFQWYHDHAGRLLLLHLDPKRRFPLDTFLCANSSLLTDAQRSSGLTTLFGEIHLPLLFWPDGSLHEVSTDARTTKAVQFNRCVVDLFGRLWRGGREHWRCPVYGGCNLPMKDADDCLNRPWKKGWRHPTCPYGMAARVFGIDQGKSFALQPFGSAATPAPAAIPDRRRRWKAALLLLALGAATAWGLIRLLRPAR